jgi:hypothetical protein
MFMPGLRLIINFSQIRHSLLSKSLFNRRTLYNFCVLFILFCVIIRIKYLLHQAKLVLLIFANQWLVKGGPHCIRL